MPPPDPERLRNIGAAVRRAREARRLSIDAIAERAGMSPVTWGNVEAGRSVKRLTYRGVEAGLNWPAGAIDDMLAATDDSGGPAEETIKDVRVVSEGMSEAEVLALFAKIKDASMSDRAKVDLMMQVVEMYGAQETGETAAG